MTNFRSCAIEILDKMMLSKPTVEEWSVEEICLWRRSDMISLLFINLEAARYMKIPFTENANQRNIEKKPLPTKMHNYLSWDCANCIN